MERIHIKKWLGPDCSVVTEVVSDVRDWHDWLQPCMSRLSGGLRTGETGIHAFIFMRRKGRIKSKVVSLVLTPSKLPCANPSDLPADMQNRVEATGPGARLHAPHPLDIIALLKRRASDNSLCQAPVLVLPHGRAAVLSPLPLKVKPRIPHRLSDEWLQLAEYLIHHGLTQSSARTVRYLVALAGGSLGGKPLPDLPHLRSAARGVAIIHGIHDVIDFQGALREVLPVMHFKASIRKASPPTAIDALVAA